MKGEPDEDVWGLRVLAVDDELPARRDLVRMLEASELVERVDSASSGSEAIRQLSEAGDRYHGLFIDVRMPDLNGLELARVLRRFVSPPPVVFVTAYPEAAVEAFELRALDYLVKPVSRRRLEESLERLRSASTVEARRAVGVGPHQPAGPDPGDDEEIVPLDSARGGTKRLVARSSILFLRAQGDYVRVVTEDGRFLLRGTLGEIARRWEPSGFVRVHRRYVVNLRRAIEIRPQLNGTALLVFPGEHEVPVARREVPELRRRLHL